MRNIALVTFRSKKYGEGHFIRTQRLAKHLHKNNKLYLVINNSSKISRSLVGIYEKIFELKNEEDVSFFKKNFSKNDLIWFDLPDKKKLIKNRYVSLTANLVAINMFGKCVDAPEKLSFFPAYQETKRVIMSNSIEIIGKNCLTVPSNFFSTKKEKEKQLIVSMGGGDPMGFTKMLLPILVNLKIPDYHIKTILPKNLLKNDFQKFNTEQHFIFNFGELDFSNELKKSSLAIINGGMTRYECVAAKTFFIALSIHTKQFDITSKVTKFGLGYNFGVLRSNKLNKLAQYIEQIFNKDNFPMNSNYPELTTDSAQWMYDSALKELGLK